MSPFARLDKGGLNQLYMLAFRGEGAAVNVLRSPAWNKDHDLDLTFVGTSLTLSLLCLYFSFLVVR